MICRLIVNLNLSYLYKKMTDSDSYIQSKRWRAAEFVSKPVTALLERPHPQIAVWGTTILP
jgi:hypothetical protein